MLKKLLCAAAVIMTAMTTVAGAEAIAEYDFGKEVLRLQGEDYTECEYPELFGTDSQISASSTWDNGKALRVNNDYDLLPAEDADGKITFTYDVDVPYTGNYKIMFQASGAGTGSSQNYHSQWDLAVDGVAAGITKTTQRTVDITTIYYYTGRLEAGKHTLSVNIPKAVSGNNGKDCGRFYFTLDYIDFHYYYDIENNFSGITMRDAADANATYGTQYGEMIRFTGAKTQDCYAVFDITAPEEGYYVIDFEAQQEDLGAISQFEAYINNSKIDAAVLHKLMYGRPVYNTTSGREGERQYLRNYQLTVYLNEGENELKLVALNDGHTNQWLLMDRLTVSDMNAPEAEKAKVEGENAYNLSEVYAMLEHGAAKLFGYSEFSNGVAMQTYGTRSDGSTDAVELRYIVDAPATGAYNMGILCNSAGSDFDMVINNISCASVRANSTRTPNAIAMANSKTASDMYLYSYNNRVYLNKGENEIKVLVNPRAEDGQFIVDIDYFDFILKEAGANEPELAVTGVIYNGFDSAPQAGANSVDFILSNPSPFEAQDACVIAAVYNDYGLKNVYTESANVAAGSETPVYLSGLRYENGDTVKIFVWRMSDLKPLASGVYVYEGE